MKLPIGFDALDGESCKFYVLSLNKSLYELKQVVTIGLQNSVMDFKIVASCKSTLTLAFSLGQDALFSHMWMTVSL